MRGIGCRPPRGGGKEGAVAVGRLSVRVHAAEDIRYPNDADSPRLVRLSSTFDVDHPPPARVDIYRYAQPAFNFEGNEQETTRYSQLFSVEFDKNKPGYPGENKPTGAFTVQVQVRVISLSILQTSTMYIYTLY